MVLYGKAGLPFTRILDRFIIEVDVGHFNMTSLADGIGIYAKPWFWVVISQRPVSQVFHRVVESAMTVVQFKRGHPVGQGQSWWPRQIPKTGLFFRQNRFHRGYGVVHRSRITRAV